jgi:long-subunit acyl-CoA synthetase (AMP-forming)
MNHTHRTTRPAGGPGATEPPCPAAHAPVTGLGAAATLCEAFQATVARDPGGVALRALGGAVTITWHHYASRVRQIAAGLASLGVGRGDTVALMMANRPEFHLADTAAFHLGAVPFSVYTTFAPGQIQHVLGNAGARVVVCEQQFARRLRDAAGGTAVEHVVCVDDRPDGTLTLAELAASGDPGFEFDARWRAVRPGDLLTLIYTSGTTGPPKGVEITHAHMAASFQAAASVLPVPPGPGDRAVSYLPMAHVAERWFSHYTALFTGLQVTPLADAKELLGALREVRPTMFIGVPRVWEKLKAGIETLVAGDPDPNKRHATRQAFQAALEYVAAAQAGPVPAGLAQGYHRADELVLSVIRSAVGLDQVHFAGCGAAPVAPEVLTFWHALGIPVAEAWGMSETCGVAIVNPPGAIRIGTVGTPIPGVQLRLAGDGELLVRGPAVMQGYYHDPAGTAEAIDGGGWLHTGDLAAIDADGYVTITGRKKELIINAAGKNISPANIENTVLAACPLIAHAVAIGDRRPYLVALIVLDPEAAALFAAQHGTASPLPAVLAACPAIRAAVAAAVDTANGRLSRVEQIKRFAILPVFWEPGGDEITPTMKLKRAPIAVKYADVVESLYTTAGEPAPASRRPA